MDKVFFLLGDGIIAKKIMTLLPPTVNSYYYKHCSEIPHDALPDSYILIHCNVKETISIVFKKKQTQGKYSIPILLIGDKIEAINNISEEFIFVPESNDTTLTALSVTSILNALFFARDINPITGLMGSNVFYQHVEKIIEKNTPFACHCIDLENFKAYNERYGFIRGDQVLRFSAEVIQEVVVELDANSALYHIGGDDFAVIASLACAEEICKAVITRFDKEIPSFYDAEDRRQGFISTQSNLRETNRFPMLSLSIAVVHNQHRRIIHIAEIYQIAAELKKKLKTIHGSRYLFDIGN